MITGLSLSNFKAFQSLDAEFRDLTVLTGLNSSGKSSVIQALLLTELAREVPSSVPLNGPYGLSLGEATDVLNFEARSSDIAIEVRGSGWSDRFEFGVPADRAVALPLRPVQPSAEAPRIGSYLSAERLGPRDLLEVDPDTHAALGEDAASPLGESLSVGHQGQYTSHVLAQYDRSQVREELRYPVPEGADAPPITLLTQTQLWLSDIVRPVSLQATWLPQTNAATVRFRGLDARTDWMRPANVGFGLSYALPIVVAALTTAPGTLMIVENPEAHLHPAGQSAIGRFLAICAGVGVQTIVETHSDHVLNGIRRAVAELGAIAATDVIVHFFAADAAKISLGETGSLSSWPPGFFDQAETDLSALARVGKK